MEEEKIKEEINSKSLAQAQEENITPVKHVTPIKHNGSVHWFVQSTINIIASVKPTLYTKDVGALNSGFPSTSWASRKFS